MSTDLHDLFARAGQTAPTSSVDPDLVVRRGRRLRARRRRVAASTLLVGVGCAVFASAAVASNPPWRVDPAPVAPAAGGPAVPRPTERTPTATPTPAESTPPVPPAGARLRPDRAGLQSVFLADPAPGFPVRRAVDSLEQMNLGEHGSPCWVRTFLVATAPATETTDSAGGVSGRPSGPEATVLVGGMAEARPGPDGTIDGARVVATPTVAGVEGYLTRDAEKGTPRSTLYFSSGAFRVEVHGFGDVSQTQLVDLGNAIEGLPQP